MTDVPWTPGPWKWEGEDYRAGWGWQILVGPNGEGLVVGEGHDGGPFKGLRAHMPLDPALCKTGMLAGPATAHAVHVFLQANANARLIAEAPAMAEALEQIEQMIDYGQYAAAQRIIETILARIKGATP